MLPEQSPRRISATQKQFGSETYEVFDPLPNKILQTVRQGFDGTCFNGTNALFVEFDDQGQVIKIRSFNIFDNSEAIPFIRGNTGGWTGEGGFYGDSVVLGKRLNAVVEVTTKEWKLWKETVGQQHEVSFRDWMAEREKQRDLVDYASIALQRSHDYYARLAAEGNLKDEDLPNYRLVMEREKEGLVKPYIHSEKKGV